MKIPSPSSIAISQAGFVGSRPNMARPGEAQTQRPTAKLGSTAFGGWLIVSLVVLFPLADARAQFDTVVEHGPSSNRVNAFFLGDGYTSANITAGTYATHVQNYVNYMFADAVNSDPFSRYQNYFNIYRVNVVSAQSGADEPQNGIIRDTALDATYRFDGVTDRLLYINETKAHTALNAAIAGSGKTVNMRYVTVNDTVYGGGGGAYAVYAGGNSSAREIGLHEMAHSFSSLADEYGGPGTYYGEEPAELNVTKDSTGAKWSPWLGYNDPAGGVVGAFEGGRYFDHGIYRPTANSKMRTLEEPFNAVDREALILDIYRIVDPLDSFTTNALPLVDPTLLSGARIDNSIIETQWFVDDIQQLTFNNFDSLNPLTLGLDPGEHSVKLRAYDPTGFDPTNGWVRRNTDLLEQSVTWNVLITVPEPTSLLMASMGCCAAIFVGLRQRARKHPAETRLLS